MPVEIVEVAIWVCHHCGHRWHPRKEIAPVKCPKCQRLRP